MKIKLSICTAAGTWWHCMGDVPDGSDKECYALKPQVCRLWWWGCLMLVPNTIGYRVLRWEVMP